MHTPRADRLKVLQASQRMLLLGAGSMEAPEAWVLLLLHTKPPALHLRDGQQELPLATAQGKREAVPQHESPLPQPHN